MSDNNKAGMDDVQMSALAASATILIFAAIYWAVQIQGVREMLEMAYG
jgi:hypothetical protein